MGMTMSIDEKIALSFQRELNGLRRHTVPKKPRVSALPDDFVAVKRELEGKKIKIKRENDMLPRKYSHRDNTYDDLPLPRGGVDLSPRNRKRSRREDEVRTQRLRRSCRHTIAAPSPRWSSRRRR